MSSITKPRKRKINLPLIEVIVASAVLHVVGLFILGGLVIYQNLKPEEAEFEPPPLVEDDPIQEVKVKLKSMSKKSPPPMRRIAVTNISDLNPPTISIDVPQISAKAGFSGYGKGGSGLGVDMAKMSIDFFGISDNAERVAYVVDYSGSMSQPVEKGKQLKRETIMRQELSRSLESIPTNTQIAMIFFSGPVWEYDEDFKKAQNRFTNKSAKGGERGGAHDYVYAKGQEPRPPKWENLTGGRRNRMLDIVEETKLSHGTTWWLPFEAIFKLDPAPEVIYFLTDGSTSNTDVAKTLEMVKDWSRKNPKSKIHTIALGEPRASQGLQQIAKETKGKFRLVMKPEEVSKGES